MSAVLTVYLCIFLVGFVFLFFSFISGLDHHVDIGHDAVNPGEASSETMSPSFFSAKVIACFLIGAGLGASLSRLWIVGEDPVSFLGPFTGYAFDALMGLVGGFAMGFLGWLIIKMFLSQQSSTGYGLNDFVGKRCQVLVTIPAGSTGEVSGTVKGINRWLDVKNETNEPLRASSWVEIIAISGTVGVARKCDGPTQ